MIHTRPLRTILDSRLTRPSLDGNNDQCALRTKNSLGFGHWLVVLPQVHPRVQRGHLVGVAIEHQGLPAEELADSTLGGLAPAGMVHGGVDVGEKAVLLGRG